MKTIKEIQVDCLLVVDKMILESLTQIEYLQYQKIKNQLIEIRKLKK